MGLSERARPLKSKCLTCHLMRTRPKSADPPGDPSLPFTSSIPFFFGRKYESVVVKGTGAGELEPLIPALCSPACPPLAGYFIPLNLRLFIYKIEKIIATQIMSELVFK